MRREIISPSAGVKKKRLWRSPEANAGEDGLLYAISKGGAV